MKIAIASDHAGFEAKQSLIKYLEDKQYIVKDFGTNSSDSCDYPDFALKCANAVADKEYEFGILICGTGIGMSICANKVKGIRCALCQEEFGARMTREHNDANMIAFGARVISVDTMEKLVDIFISTPFSNLENHVRRLSKISAYENSNK